MSQQVIKEAELKNFGLDDINIVLGADAQNIDISLSDGTIVKEVISGYKIEGSFYQENSITSPMIIGESDKIYIDLNEQILTPYKYVDGAFVPTVMSNQTLADYLHKNENPVLWSDESVVGAVNLIPFLIGDHPFNENGIIIYNYSGHITIDGTATATTIYTIPLEHVGSAMPDLKFTIDFTERYNGVSSTTVRGCSIELENSSHHTINGSVFDRDSDGSAELTIPAGRRPTYFKITIYEGAEFTGHTTSLSPMLRLATVKDRTFVPYAMTNRALTNRINDLHSSFAELDDVDINSETLEEGQVPQYNNTTEKWENKTIEVDKVKQILSNDNESYDILLSESAGAGTLIEKAKKSHGLRYNPNLNSLMVGSGTTASGQSSVALGNNTLASGQNSIAEGNQTVTGHIKPTFIRWDKMPKNYNWEVPSDISFINSLVIDNNNIIHIFDKNNLHYSWGGNNWVKESNTLITVTSATFYNDKIHTFDRDGYHYSWTPEDGWQQETRVILDYPYVVADHNKIYAVGWKTSAGTHRALIYSWDGDSWTVARNEFLSRGTSIDSYNISSCVIYNNKMHINIDSYHFIWDINQNDLQQSENIAASRFVVHGNQLFKISSDYFHRWDNSREVWVYIGATPYHTNSGSFLIDNDHITSSILFSYNNNIYIYDNHYGTYCFYRYNENSYCWDGSSLPIYVSSDTKAVFYNNKIHLLNPDHYSWDGNNWEREGNLPENINLSRSSEAIVYNNKIYIFTKEYVDNTNRSSLYSWNGSNWVRESTLPYYFDGGESVVYNGKIHILGGDDPLGAGVYRYHYSWDGEAWEQESTLPYNFVFPGGAIVYNNKIHIFGSSSSANSRLHYSWNGEAWEQESILPYDFYNTNLATIIYNDKIHILGSGVDSYSLPYPYTCHYSWNGEVWLEESTLPFDLKTGNAVVYNQQIYILQEAYRFYQLLTNFMLIGGYSHAEGYQSQAKVDYSHAEGYRGVTTELTPKTGKQLLHAVGGEGGNVQTLDWYGNMFLAGAPYLKRGTINGVLVANGPTIVLEDGASYVLYTQSRLTTNGTFRGIQAYFISATWNPIGTTAGNGTSTTAQAVPQIASLGTVGTVGMNVAKQVAQYTNSDGNIRYHSQIGLGSCTTQCCARWVLVKVAPGMEEFDDRE